MSEWRKNGRTGKVSRNRSRKTNRSRKMGRWREIWGQERSFAP